MFPWVEILGVINSHILGIETDAIVQTAAPVLYSDQSMYVKIKITFYPFIMQT